MGVADDLLLSFEYALRDIKIEKSNLVVFCVLSRFT
ncbi:MAG: hypothetical protein ACO2ON_01960 [Candidatus Nanopusillus sp.]